MQVRAATVTHWPFWQAVPGPHDGVQASGTQEPSTQTFPVPQKSAQVLDGVEVVQAASAERSSAASRWVLPFKCGSFPDGMTVPRPLAAMVGGSSLSTARTNDVGDFPQPVSAQDRRIGAIHPIPAGRGVHRESRDETLYVQP